MTAQPQSISEYSANSRLEQRADRKIKVHLKDCRDHSEKSTLINRPKRRFSLPDGNDRARIRKFQIKTFSAASERLRKDAQRRFAGRVLGIIFQDRNSVTKEQE